MKMRKSFLIAAICLVLGSAAAFSSAQQAGDDFADDETLSAAAKLVVTGVSGPAFVFLNQSISVTYTVKNQGNQTSGAYKVGLYLSTDKTIDPATDRLLGEISFSTGLAAGKSRKTTSKVVVPVNGLSGAYYFGAVVGISRKASSAQVSIIRYAEEDNGTIIDHRTGLVWQKADDNQTRSYDDAVQYCLDLVLGGHDDWRAPRIDELLTIVDYSRSAPAIDPTFQCSSWFYWSGSGLAGYPDTAWDVYFETGYSSWWYKSDLYYIRCVRGGPW